MWNPSGNPVAGLINKATGFNTGAAKNLGSSSNLSLPAPAQFQQQALVEPIGGGSGGGGASYDTAAVAQYDQGINNANSALNRLGVQLDSGRSGIDASWQNALNQLLLSKNQGEKSYNLNKKSTADDYVSAKNTIGANAGNTLNSVLRLLGSRGAGGSSAYNIAAPGAVSRTATIQRSEASGTNAKNNQALDLNWGNFMTGYTNQVSSANSQREQQRQQLEAQIENSRGTLLQTLAQLAGMKASAMGGNAAGAAQPYIDQANSALDRAVNFRVNPISYQTQAYEAPSLGSYNTNPAAAPTYQGQGPSSDYYSPYLSALLGKKQQATA